MKSLLYIKIYILWTQNPCPCMELSIHLPLAHLFPFTGVMLFILRMSLRMNCNNVSMCIQCHKFGTFNQWTGWDHTTFSAHHFWYVEDDRNIRKPYRFTNGHVKSLWWKKPPKAIFFKFFTKIFPGLKSVLSTEHFIHAASLVQKGSYCQAFLQ